MKSKVLFYLIALMVLVSCKTREKVVYFQDTDPSEIIATQEFNKTLQLVPGDKVSIIVTSSKTPDIATRYNLMSSSTSSSGSQSVDNLRYTVDEEGNIDMLGLGRIHIAGLTRSEAASKIQNIFRNGILNDAVVTVAAYNRYITILGEVSNPGRFEISRDEINILEAIGLAGDLTITGRRDAVKVLRKEGTNVKTYYVDLRSKNILNSPVYYLQQNDIVYVEPNNVKLGEATHNGNSIRNISTWLSLSSFFLSLGILIFKD